MSALHKFYTIISESPAGYLAFLSHYQIGIIQMEYLKNFGEALSEFEYCMQNYPENFFSREQRNDISKRITLLNENAVDDWRPLRLYLQARGNPHDVGLVLYRELLQKYSQLKIAKKASREIVRDVLSSRYEDTTTPRRVIGMFQALRNSTTDKALEQYLQVGIADIMNYRLLNPDQALLEYSRGIQIDPSSSIATMARQRIKEIYKTRSGP